MAPTVTKPAKGELGALLAALERVGQQLRGKFEGELKVRMVDRPPAHFGEAAGVKGSLCALVQVRFGPKKKLLGFIPMAEDLSRPLCFVDPLFFGVPPMRMVVARIYEPAAAFTDLIKEEIGRYGEQVKATEIKYLDNDELSLYIHGAPR